MNEKMYRRKLGIQKTWAYAQEREKWSIKGSKSGATVAFILLLGMRTCAYAQEREK